MCLLNTLKAIVGCTYEHYPTTFYLHLSLLPPDSGGGVAYLELTLSGLHEENRNVLQFLIRQYCSTKQRIFLFSPQEYQKAQVAVAVLPSSQGLLSTAFLTTATNGNSFRNWKFRASLGIFFCNWRHTSMPLIAKQYQAWQTSRVIVRLERSTGFARKIAATSRTSRRTLEVAATLISISSLSENAWCVMSSTCCITKKLAIFWLTTIVQLMVTWKTPSNFISFLFR